jgi:hypothetical protein
VPILLSTLGIIVAGSVSTGGLAALAVKISRKKNNSSEVQNPSIGENNYDSTDT